MTEADIQKVIVRTLFHWRRHICVPNVDWGFLPWEADLVVLRQSGWCDEIEIKTNISDLRRDKKKYRHHLGVSWAKTQRIRKLYYAAPEAVWEKVVDGDLPTGSGRIAILCADDKPQLAKIITEAVSKTDARKLTDKERFMLARLGCLRYWCREGIK